MSNRLLLGFSFWIACWPAWAGTCAVSAPADLPHSRAALAGRGLSVLVVASGGVAAETGADGEGLASQIESAMRGLQPDLTLDFDTLDNKGELVSEILPRLATRLGQRPVQLVVLQAGGAEVFRGTPAADFGASLSSAVAVAENDGADVLLVDPDPDPLLAGEAGFPVIEALLAQAGSRPGVAFFSQQDAGLGCAALGIADSILRP